MNKSKKNGNLKNVDLVSSKREYLPPKILSSENLEATAATCDGAGGFGKPSAMPPCNPATTGS